MASVSSAAIDKRFCPLRSKYFFSAGSCSARVAKRQPPAACSSMKPPMFASSVRLISSSWAMTASRPPSSANASARSSVRTGSLLRKRMASMVARSSLGSMTSVVEQRELRRIDLLLRSRKQDVAEVLALLQGDPAEAHQLERAEEDGDQLVAVAVLQEPLQADGRLLTNL